MIFFFTLLCVHSVRYNWEISLSELLQHLDVDEISDEGHEDHLISVPTLSGVYFNPSLQLPPLATVPHEDLKEGMGGRIKNLAGSHRK